MFLISNGMNNKTSLIIGIIIILTPFSGFPKDIKTFIFILAGLVIVIVSLKRIRAEHKKRGYHHKEKHKDVFVESRPPKIITKTVENSIELTPVAVPPKNILEPGTEIETPPDISPKI